MNHGPQALNPRQREAVLHGEGPLLILAGAGTGKTRTLAYRIAHLVERGVPADAILAVAFTNKSADELKAIPGIGDAYSAKIIEGRPYRAKNELVQKKILPQAVYDKVKGHIVARQEPAKKK